MEGLIIQRLLLVHTIVISSNVVTHISPLSGNYLNIIERLLYPVLFNHARRLALKSVFPSSESEAPK